MNSESIRQRLGAILVFFFKLYGRLPITTAGRIGEAVGRFLWLVPSDAKAVTKKNIELCFPSLDSDQQSDLARSSYLETCRTMGEIASTWARPDQLGNNIITHVENSHLMDAAQAHGSGVILIAPHFGNWELGNLYAAQHYPLAVMYKPAELIALNQLILRARVFYGSTLLTADRKGVIGMFGALSKGNVVGVLPDQEPTVATGEWAPFFGVPALTPKLISRAIQKTGAVALGYCCQRNPDGKTFHIAFEPIADAIRSTDLVESVTALNQCIERIIMRDPKQYQWEYKRFKRRPGKAPNPYRSLQS